MMALIAKSGMWTVTAVGTHDREPIDFGAIAARADLRSLVETECGPPGRNRRFHCPFHEDHNPDLALYQDDRKFHCFGCGAKGDAIDWIARLDGLTPVEAARKLAGLADQPDDRPRTPRPAPRPRPAPAESWREPGWQGAVDIVIERAKTNLWDPEVCPEGRAALQWLRARGLADDTIRCQRLGFLPTDGMLDTITWSRGITIPWAHPSSWYVVPAFACPEDPAPPKPQWVGVNVRRLALDPAAPLPEGQSRYRALPGSARGYPYPFGMVAPGVPALVCEGELDALLAHQEVGHVVNVLTFGGADQAPRPEGRSALAACPYWLLAFDCDPRSHAGSKGARKLAATNPRKARRLWLPHGKDLTEFYQAGGRLLDWLDAEFRRLGWKPINPMEPRR